MKMSVNDFMKILIGNWNDILKVKNKYNLTIEQINQIRSGNYNINDLSHNLIKLRCKLCGDIIYGENIEVMKKHWEYELHSLDCELDEYLKKYVEVVRE